MFKKKQGRKRPLDTPKRMIERRRKKGRKEKLSGEIVTRNYQEKL